MTPVAVVTDGETWVELVAALARLGLSPPVDPAERTDLTWVAAAELLADPAPFVERLGRELDAPSTAIAASILAKQLTPLVVSPVVGALATRGVVLDLSAPNLRVGFAGGGVGAVAAATPRVLEGPIDRLLDRAAGEVIDGVVGALVGALRRLAPLGTRHLWGNAALAVQAPVAALLATSDHDGRAVRDALLDRLPQLRDLVEVLDVDGAGGARLEAVRRRTCCLLYRLPPPHGGYCGTCSLHPADEHRRQLVAYYRELHLRHAGEA